MTKNGLRTFDARRPVLSLAVVEPDDTRGPGDDAPGDSPPCAILRLVVRHVTPAVRPDDVLAGLATIGDLAPPSTPAVTRLAQGPLDESAGTVSDPLAPDRGDVGT